MYFEREIQNIEEYSKETNNKSMYGKYIDLDKNLDVNQETKNLLNDLKYKKIASSNLSSDNIIKLEVLN